MDKLAHAYIHILESEIAEMPQRMHRIFDWYEDLKRQIKLENYTDAGISMDIGTRERYIRYISDKNFSRIIQYISRCRHGYYRNNKGSPRLRVLYKLIMSRIREGIDITEMQKRHTRERIDSDYLVRDIIKPVDDVNLCELCEHVGFPNKLTQYGCIHIKDACCEECVDILMTWKYHMPSQRENAILNFFVPDLYFSALRDYVPEDIIDHWRIKNRRFRELNIGVDIEQVYHIAPFAYFPSI